MVFLFWQNLQDEMMDLMDVSNEIQESLGRSYNVPDDIDEEDLMGGKPNGTTCYPYSKEYVLENFELIFLMFFPSPLNIIFSP